MAASHRAARRRRRRPGEVPPAPLHARVAKPVSMHFEYPFPETGTPAERRKAAVALMRAIASASRRRSWRRDRGAGREPRLRGDRRLDPPGRAGRRRQRAARDGRLGNSAGAQAGPPARRAGRSASAHRLDLRARTAHSPVRFKGGYMSEIWQTAVLMESESGGTRVGIGTQNVCGQTRPSSRAAPRPRATRSCTRSPSAPLRSRAMPAVPLPLRVAGRDPRAGARVCARGHGPRRPAQDLHAQRARARRQRGLAGARRRERISGFDALIRRVQAGAASRHTLAAAIPSWRTRCPWPRSATPQPRLLLHEDQDRPAGHAGRDAREGQGPPVGNPRGHRRDGNPAHADGRLPYYFDANGRYESKDSLLRLLITPIDRRLDRIAILEEPFPEDVEAASTIWACASLPTRARTPTRRGAADRPRLRRIALKPIAKTLSMTLKIARLAHARGIPCFCADLTVTRSWSIGTRSSPRGSRRCRVSRSASWRRTDTRTTGTGSPCAVTIRRSARVDAAREGRLPPRRRLLRP